LGAFLSSADRHSTPPAAGYSGGAADISTTPQGAGGFSELDERLLSQGVGAGLARVLAQDGPQILIARATSLGAAAALEHHASRRWNSIHAAPVRASARAGAPLWHDIATKLRISLDDNDPAHCAEKIAQALSSRPVVAPLPAASTWDRAVLEELARLDLPLVLFFTTANNSNNDDTTDLAAQLRAQLFEISAELDAEAQRRWFSAAADAAQTSRSGEDLASLDAWWSTAERVAADADANALTIPEAGKELFSALALVARAWPVAKISLLIRTAGSPDEKSNDALDALVDAGIAVSDRGWLSLAPAWSKVAEAAALAADSKICARVADALLASFDDSWSLAVAADLLVRRNDLERAEATHALAVARAGDSLVRREVVDRWSRTTAALPADVRLAQCVRAGERALDSGEADEAFRWAQAAASIGGDDSAVALLLGQSAVAMGDLLTGRVALEKARTGGAPVAMQKLIAAELSEIAYASEDFETATKEASSALDAPSGGETTKDAATTRLKARNTLGKVLLARSQWEEAEEHFAEDVCYAVANGGRTAELRARLNRGIAILSSNRIEEAKAIFESVLHDGELLHEARACAFAHENLAVVAMWRHDYGDALHWFELAVKLRQRLNDKLKIVLNLGNLAQLRYKLGLFEHAEQAILFGRRVLSPGMPQTNSARFSVEAARLALSRGRTAEAQREIARAIAEGENAGHRIKMAGEAYRLAARIALEDGDLARAREAIAKAESFNGSDEARAEIAVLKATVQRAAGTPDLRAAEEALILVRALGEEELLREIHVLLFELYRAAGETERALLHIDQAIGMRDQVARVLTGDVREAFLARRDVVALDRLRSLVGPNVDPNSNRDSSPISSESSDVDLDEGPRTSRSRASIAPQAPRELVGDDPSIRALRAAIKKVARSGSTVLVRGESGTGKELVAEALHRASDRANGPLVSVNCAALVETLLLSELFGHEKGAFTGAAARRRGRFELAEGGTLFLDEIGDISPRTQVALLRVLQERTFERVGGTTPIHANVRIVCATHRDLKAMVERGDFREDLYYRLRGITLEVPALRQRLGDLPRISETLLARIAVERSETPKTLSPAAIQLLSRHRWAGNVRELENALRAATLFAEGNVISANDLIDNVEDLRPLGANQNSQAHQNASASRPIFSPIIVSGVASASSGPSVAAIPASHPAPEDSATLPVDDASDDDGEMPLPNTEAGPTEVSYACVRAGSVSLSDLKRQIERDCIARALAETKGNITRAAALLGMKRPRLSQLVKQYGLSAVSEGQS
jgi:DNA-binding NtrC family response regulator/tetratricopeptide (TPR) repeat protein